MDDIKFLLALIVLFQFLIWMQGSASVWEIRDKFRFRKGKMINKLKKWKRNR